MKGLFLVKPGQRTEPTREQRIRAEFASLRQRLSELEHQILTWMSPPEAA